MMIRVTKTRIKKIKSSCFFSRFRRFSNPLTAIQLQGLRFFFVIKKVRRSITSGGLFNEQVRRLFFHKFKNTFSFGRTYLHRINPRCTFAQINIGTIFYIVQTANYFSGKIQYGNGIG